MRDIDVYNFSELEDALKYRDMNSLICRYFRQLLFLFINLMLRHPAWLLLHLIRFLRLFDYLFLVYPGVAEDLDAYCPQWLARSRLFSGKPSIGGIITKGKASVSGLVLVIPDDTWTLLRNKKLCEEVMNRLLWIRNIVGAKAIAMAGQIPGIFIRHGINLDYPFVSGTAGTVFCITETIEKIFRNNISKRDTNIVIVGVGHVGLTLLNHLSQEQYQVAGIDIKVRKQGVYLSSESRKILQCADIVVVLTPKGEDFIPYLNDIRKDTIIVDDTHPRIRNCNGRNMYKVAMGLKGCKIIPRLPGYDNGWIPGCAIEAIHASITGFYKINSQTEFNRQLRDIGFSPHLVEGISMARADFR